MNEIFIILSSMSLFFLVFSVASWRESRRQRLEKRLRLGSSASLVVEVDGKPDVATQIGGIFYSEEWLWIQVFLIGVVLITGVIFHLPLFAIVVLGTGALAAPFVFVRWRQSRREHILESQLEGALLDMAAALWANPSLKEAFEAARNETQEPLKDELDRALKEIECGVGVDTALISFLERNRSGALKVAVHAMLICRETGGNLAPVLERTAELIRSRLLLQGEISALTSQQRTTALVISLVPVGFLVLTQVFNPGYLNYLFTPLGTLLLLYSVGSIAIGFLVLRKMADLLPKGDQDG